MFAEITWGKEKLGHSTVGSVAIWQVQMPRTGLHAGRRRARLWKKLRSLGVRHALLPRELRQEAAVWNITEPSPAPLRQALTASLLALLPSWQSATLRAPRADTAVYTAAACLCERVRYLRLEVPQGGEALADWLRRQWGLSVGYAGQTDGGICFAGVPKPGELCLGEDCGTYQQISYEVAGESVAEEYLTVLWLSGAVSTKQIRPLSVENRLDTWE